MMNVAAKLDDKVAAIDDGNHCFCGGKGALAKDSALKRPMAECETQSCYADSEDSR